MCKGDIMLLTVAICDDDNIQLRELTRLLSEWGMKGGYMLNIQTYTSAESFLFSYADCSCDLLLLDIEMGAKNGVELARQLRSQGDMLPVIFVTGYSDYMSDGYDVEALHYLLKPISREKFFAVLNRFVQRRKDKGNLVISGKEGTIHLVPEEILYCEAAGKKTQIYMRDKKVFVCDEGIGAFFLKLTADFVFCHRSYIVNLRCVRSIGREQIQLDGGERIPLSRRLREEVNLRFVRFYTE